MLASQVRQAFANSRSALDGLSDAEFTREPVPGAWSVRLRHEAGRGWGIGEYVCEDAWPPPDPLPVTTIAWRLTHLAAWTEVYLDWTFGAAEVSLDHVQVPGTCPATVDWYDDVARRYVEEVDRVDDEELAELRPAHWGEMLPTARLVSIMITEHAHHLAEIGLLRDLYAGHARSQDPPPQAWTWP